MDQVKLDYIVDLLRNMFGAAVNTDIIESVVLQCNGNVQESIDALSTICENAETGVDDSNALNLENNCIQGISYSTAASKPSTLQKKSQDSIYLDTLPKSPQGIQFKGSRTFLNFNQNSKTTSIDVTRIINFINEGYRLLVFMRGLPGSGKSTLAKYIINETVKGHYKTYICSTDDYFMNGNRYEYNVNNLSAAHSWNQNRVHKMLCEGVSPIIVDNTNLEMWEMKPYAASAVMNGYEIEIVEPFTPWARNIKELSHRNTHNIPIAKIRQMNEKYEASVTVDSLKKTYDLNYPFNMIPPKLRNMPKVSELLSDMPNKKYTFNEIDGKPTDELAKVTTDNSSDLAVNDKYDEKTSETTLNNELKFYPNKESVEINKISHIIDLPNLITGLQNDVSKIKTSKTNEEDSNFEPSEESLYMVNNKSDIFDQSSSITNLQCTPNVISAQISDNTKTGLNYQLCSKTTKPKIDSSHNHAISDGKLNCDIKKDKLTNSDILKLYENRMSMNKNLVAETVQSDNNSRNLLIQWSNKESWNEQDENVTKLNRDCDSGAPKPQRQKKDNTDGVKSETLLQHFEPFTDWTTIENQWNSFNVGEANWKTLQKDISKSKVKESSTNTHGNDIVSCSDRILVGKCREINNEVTRRRINRNPPLVLRLDKSSMTEDDIEIAKDTQETDKEFLKLCNMFTKINLESLKEIYNQCNGDLNWAVDVVLEELEGNNLQENSTLPESNTSRIVETKTVSKPRISQGENCSTMVNNAGTNYNENQISKYKRKDKALSDSSFELKRHLEENFVIPDSLYSEHCLKIRKLRRGESLLDDTDQRNSKEHTEVDNYDRNESHDNTIDEMDSQEEIYTVCLGTNFIRQIDKMFDTVVDYPDTISPVISMPKSLLSQIHALWIESHTHQINVQHELSTNLLKEDEEFARLLMEKDKEHANNGLPQKVPNLQEIMDMELAFALSNAELKSLNDKGEEDLATKLSKQKLTELFPDVDKKTLFEILAAHDNKFEQTVQVLLLSLGMSDGNEDENAVSRLITRHDWEKKQANLLEKAQQEMTKLSIDDENDQVYDVEQAKIHREEARRHLDVRNRYHSQAQDYFKKGMYQVASYYSQIAALHKKKFDLANLRAANSLVQVHSTGSDKTTLDLHYLYVAEALEALDVFIDSNITELVTSVATGPYTIKQRSLFLITGRGAHSIGAPRIKPAVKKRLKQRSIRFAQVNAGVLSVTVDNTSKLTCQL